MLLSRGLLKPIACTAFALLAFAGNSVICRLALGTNSIDAASFTSLRLLSGILALLLIVKLRAPHRSRPAATGWGAPFMLFLYAVAFSFAYVSLDTGVGALILFGAVQITMIVASLVSGVKLHYSEWIGLFIAFSGFSYLVIPGLSTPSFMGFILMTIAGVAWGMYTLIGRGSKQPLNDTAHNFLYTLPFVAILMWVFVKDVNMSQQGIVLAITSGAVTSGIGYTVWYMALGKITAIQAAVVQLLVPVIAAFGGVLFVGETISTRLVLSSIMILGGIMSVVAGQYFVRHK